jgi:sec-independent protein translocase protein TatC
MMSKTDSLQHLTELRQNLIKAVLGYGAVAILFAAFAKPIFTIFAQPLLVQLPQGYMIATQIAAPFFAPLKLSLLLALGVSLPWLMYQVWAFIAPGLFAHEKKLSIFALSGCLVLFYLGMAFAYFIVVPIVLNFFVSTAPSGVEVLTDINAYVSFILKMLFAFGLSFQVPIIVLLLTRSGIVSKDKLKKQRAYIVIAAFAAAMFLTPPDVFSQSLLAIPIILLFELGLLLSK